MRVILKYELDEIYILKSNFDRTKNVKDFKEIFKYIEKLVEKN